MNSQRTIHHTDLLDEIEAFCAQAGLPKSQFGRLALRDGSLVSDLESGRELRRATIEKIRGFIRSAEAG